MALPSDEELIERIKRNYKDAEEATSDWRAEARELYDMIAGHQWSEEDRLKLMEELRPVTTFNLTAKFVDSLCGVQVNNRQEIKFFPREVGDQGVNELLTNAADWARDECDAEDEESDAFMDLVLTGVGCVELFLDMDNNPMGDIAIQRRDPLECFWDAHATRRNVRDTRWRMRIKPMPKEEIVDRWGEETYDELVGNMGFEASPFESEVHHSNENHLYEHDPFDKVTEKTVPVCHYQWFSRDDMWVVKTQFGERKFTPYQWRKIQEVLKRQNVMYSAKKERHKRYYQAFVAGDVVLEKTESPYQDGWTIHVLTGKRDRNKNNWIGVGRAIRDPQMWANKFFSNILHTINTNSKGGVILEEGAVSDPQKFESDWAKPDAVHYVEDGAISEGRIQEKRPSEYPQGMGNLMEFAINSMPQVSGISLELLGMTDRFQPGVVEAQRKQAAMAVVAWAFDALRRYYKDAGRQLGYYIREYVADGRLARVTTPEGQKYIPLLREEMTMEFDVVVDESPTSVNMKERVWGVLEQLLPQLMKMGAPIPPEVLDYSPLPADLAQSWKKMMMQASQQQQDSPEAQMAMRDKEAEIGVKESKKVLQLSQANKASAEAGATAGGK